MIDIGHIIQSQGQILSLIIIGLIVLLSAGIPFGFFLPGDTMLFTAGFFSSQHDLPLAGLIIVAIISKIIGSSLGYKIGDVLSKKLVNRKDSFFYRKEYLEKAEVFYGDHGGKTVLFAQFIPILRTFAPVVAGISKMDKKRFQLFNVIGAVLWVTIICLLGFWLGKKVPNIDKYLLPVVILTTVFSFAPAGWHLFGKEPTKRFVKSVRAKRSSRN
jgi:membrane-associated protein